MFVKICGTTNLADAELAVEAGADALGFIFAPSKRRVTVEQVAAITRLLPSRVERIGVFTEPDPEAIGRAVREASLSAVQMHWPYDPAVVAAVQGAVGEGVELWQVVGFAVDAPDQHVADKAFAETLRRALLDSRLAVVLLDSVKGGASGGQGQAFPWARAHRLIEGARDAVERARGSQRVDMPRFVAAGGLHPDNVGEAIAALRPWGVDVVSGVEMRPGFKSAEKLRAFVERAREAEERLLPLP